MLDLIGRVVPFDAANILLVQEAHLFTLRARGYERFGMETVEKITNLDLPARAYPNILKVIETGKPAYVPDNSTDPNWVGGGISPNLHSWVGAPIQFEQKVIAIFSLDKVEPDFYSQEHADRLAAFTGQAALALKNAQLFAEVQQLAITDSLTGLANRRYFFIQARQEFERSRRYKSPFSILMLDLACKKCKEVI